MSVRSMTGYARSSAALPDGELTLSIKSVNHKGLDMQLHLPGEFDPLVNMIRSRIREVVARGHLHLALSWSRTRSGGVVRADRGLVEAYLTEFRALAEAYGLDSRPDLNVALSLPGALREIEQPDVPADLAGLTTGLLDRALDEFNTFREREGAALEEEIRSRNRAVKERAAEMERVRQDAQPAFENRLRTRLDELLNGIGVEPQRLAQEAALMADRSDISEELTRLKIHAEEFDEILGAGGEVGRKLDFLLQEMNRETNTILSKSGGIGEFGLALTNEALAVKAEIDKMREQVLNLE